MTVLPRGSSGAWTARPQLRFEKSHILKILSTQHLKLNNIPFSIYFILVILLCIYGDSRPNSITTFIYRFIHS